MHILPSISRAEPRPFCSRVISTSLRANASILHHGPGVAEPSLNTRKSRVFREKRARTPLLKCDTGNVGSSLQSWDWVVGAVGMWVFIGVISPDMLLSPYLYTSDKKALLLSLIQRLSGSKSSSQQHPSGLLFVTMRYIAIVFAALTFTGSAVAKPVKPSGCDAVAPTPEPTKPVEEPRACTKICAPSAESLKCGEGWEPWNFGGGVS